MAGNIKITPFTATTVANTVVGPNPTRRGLKIQIYGPPDLPNNSTCWVDDSGKPAAVQQCWQMIPGSVWEWGRQDVREYTHALNLVNCPTGAISVIASVGTAAGIIEELI